MVNATEMLNSFPINSNDDRIPTADFNTSMNCYHVHAFRAIQSPSVVISRNEEIMKEVLISCLLVLLASSYLLKISNF